jgi:hypothetical protein
VANKFERIALEISSLTAEKNAAYGDSYTRACNILKELYPYGVQPSEYRDLLAMTRVIDKLFRIATRKDAFGESPWRDICGYSLLGIESDEKLNKDDSMSDAENEIFTTPSKEVKRKNSINPPNSNKSVGLCGPGTYFYDSNMLSTPYPKDLMCTGSNEYFDDSEPDEFSHGFEGDIDEETKYIRPPKSSNIGEEYQDIIDHSMESNEITDIAMRSTKYEGLRPALQTVSNTRISASSPYSSRAAAGYIKESYPDLETTPVAPPKENSPQVELPFPKPDRELADDESDWREYLK